MCSPSTNEIAIYNFDLFNPLSRAVPPPTRAYLRTLIHNADLEHLEKVVLDGHGQVELCLLQSFSTLCVVFPL